MLKDALDFLVGLGVKTREVQRVKLSQGRTLIVGAGEDQVIEDDRLTLTDTVETIADLKRWLEAYADGPSEVFVSRKSVIAITDRYQSHLRDSCNLPLVRSNAFAELQLWMANGFTQDQAVKALRGTLRGSYNDKLLGVFRRLNFTRSNAGGKSISHTGESLGKSVEAKAQTAEGEIPEEILFTLPVFNLPQLSHAGVLCAVTVNASTERIELMPVGDAIENAISQTLLDLRDYLEKTIDGGLVIIGTPSI